MLINSRVSPTFQDFMLLDFYLIGGTLSAKCSIFTNKQKQIWVILDLPETFESNSQEALYDHLGRHKSFHRAIQAVTTRLHGVL
jgi:hypothetical protein